MREQRTIGKFHTSAGSKHGVCENEYLVRQIGASDVLYKNVEFEFVFVFTIGRYKGIFCMVEVIQEAGMER